MKAIPAVQEGSMGNDDQEDNKVHGAADCVYYSDKNYKTAYTKEDAEKKKSRIRT